MSHYVLNFDLKITVLFNCFGSYSLDAILTIYSLKKYGEIEENK